MHEKRWILSLLLAAAAATVARMDVVNAFVLLQTAPPPRRHSPLFFQPYSARGSPARRTTRTTRTSLFTATSLPDISKMKASEMREELESYGISTKAFLEKKEFAAALKKARAEGKTPKQQQPAETKKSSTSSSSSSTTKDSSTSAASTSAARDEKMKVEMEKAQKMSVGDLRTKLKELGIKTTSFFEKSEFVRAYAEAMVDGVKKSAAAAEPEEEYDASYRDVVVQKMNARDPRLLQGTVIEIKAASSSKR